MRHKAHLLELLQTLEIRPHCTLCSQSRGDMKLCVLIAAAVLPVGAWVPSAAAPRALARRGAPLASAQLDYDDPVVAEEFKVVQRYDDGRLDFELEKLGIVAPPGMSEVDKQLMLMECRLRLNGHLDDKPKSTGPKTYASPYEEALDTKPKFAALIGKFKADGLINSVNTIIEYVNDPVLGKTRYAEGYGDLIEQVDAALAAPAVESAKLKFFGFPSNMGEGVVRQTLEAFGELKSLSVEMPDDPAEMSCGGTCEFGSVESAKKAVAQWNGADMGLGTVLTLEMVE